MQPVTNTTALRVAVIIGLGLAALACSDKDTAHQAPPPADDDAPRAATKVVAPPPEALDDTHVATQAPFLNLVASATTVRVAERRLVDGKMSSRAFELATKEAVDALLVALGREQHPAASCSECFPDVVLSFADDAKKELAQVRLCFRGQGVPPAANLATSDFPCASLAVADAASLTALLEQHAPKPPQSAQ